MEKGVFSPDQMLYNLQQMQNPALNSEQMLQTMQMFYTNRMVATKAMFNA